MRLVPGLCPIESATQRQGWPPQAHRMNYDGNSHEQAGNATTRRHAKANTTYLMRDVRMRLVPDMQSNVANEAVTRLANCAQTELRR